MQDVKVIAQRYADRPKTDPGTRIFSPSDHIVVNPEKLQSGRMYVGDEFRAVVLTLTPGQAQTVHMHPAKKIRIGLYIIPLERGRRELPEIAVNLGESPTFIAIRRQEPHHHPIDGATRRDAIDIRVHC